MGTRRTIRRFRKAYKRIIIVLSAISLVFSQAEYQVATIPRCATTLSFHNGFSALNHTSENSVTSLSYLQYPSQINLLNYSHKKFNLIFLDYGTFENKIDNNIINQFNAYECILTFNFNKKIFDLFNLELYAGGLYSKIEKYSSSALLANIKIKTQIDNIYASFSISNVGIIIQSYTKHNLKLPLKSQFSIIKKLKNNQTYLGYDNVYNFNTDKVEHIISIQTDINNNINLKLSNSNYRNELLIDNYNSDFYYGFALGVSIKTNNNSKFDIGICSLGPAGYIYGLTINF